MQLEYIVNATDKNSVVGISFPEAADISFIATENINVSYFSFNSTKPTLGTKQGKYCVRTVYVYMNNFFQEDWEGERQLHKAEVQFSDGSQLTADLGEIILYSEKMKMDNDITMVMSTASSNGSSSISYSTNNISLLSLESSALDSVENLLELDIAGVNYKDLSKIDYQSKRYLEITCTFTDLQSYKSSFDVYDLRPKLYYKNTAGTINYIRVYNINPRRYLNSFKDVLTYLIKRGIL
jgi:hypothetical protein